MSRYARQAHQRRGRLQQVAGTVPTEEWEGMGGRGLVWAPALSCEWESVGGPLGGREVYVYLRCVKGLSAVRRIGCDAKEGGKGACPAA
eukprot:351290-Chlamydomonas_euryale.AAC.2